METQQIFNRSSKIVLTLLMLVCTSCSPELYRLASVATPLDNMYATHNKEKIEAQQAAKAAYQQQIRERNREAWSQALGLNYTANNTTVAAIDYEMYNTPYGERLLALDFDSGSYQRPSSYYMYSEMLDELSNYDPSEYSASIDSDGNLVIQPIYINSFYCSWDIGYYNRDPWRYGYNAYFHHRYPRYGYPNSWYYNNFYFGLGFNSGLGLSNSMFYWGYNPYYAYQFYRPIHHGYIYWPNHYYPNYPHYNSNIKRSIVRYQYQQLNGSRPSNSSSIQSGTRQRNGSTVGTQSTRTYNRGASSSSSSSSSSYSGSSSSSSSSIVRSSGSSNTGSSSSSSSSSSSGSANPIGR